MKSTLKQSNIKNIAQLIVVKTSFFFLFTGYLQANFYYTFQGGLSAVDDIKMDVNNNDLLFESEPEVVYTEEFDTVDVLGSEQPIVVQGTEVNEYVVNIAQLIFSSQNRYNFTASSIIGYDFSNNLRFESEYRFINFKTEMTDGLVNIDAYIDIHIAAFLLDAPGDEGGEIVGEDPLFTTDENEELLGMPFSLAELINGSSDFVPSENGESPIPIVSFKQNAHLQFFNLIYDAPITEDLVFFGGVGVGFGFLAFYTLNVPDDTEIDISPWKSKYFAYQYKLGAAYNIHKNIDFVVSYSNINGIGETNIGSFTYDPVNFQTLDFGFRYNFV